MIKFARINKYQSNGIFNKSYKLKLFIVINFNEPTKINIIFSPKTRDDGNKQLFIQNISFLILLTSQNERSLSWKTFVWCIQMNLWCNKLDLITECIWPDIFFLYITGIFFYFEISFRSIWTFTLSYPKINTYKIN